MGEEIIGGFDPLFVNGPGNPYFISFDKLIEKGFLKKTDLEDYPNIENPTIDYELLYLNKYHIFDKAFQNFKKKSMFSDFDEFCKINSYWLNDFSLLV